MAELTKSGVCYDLENTPYVYGYGPFKFHFSSLTHKKAFIKKANIRMEWLTDSLSRRFKYSVSADVLAIFQLYKQVETRGFYVYLCDGDKVLRSADDISFVVHVA